MSVVQAADFVGDAKAYSQAVRELAETLFPSLHACLDGHAVEPDETSGPSTSVKLALVRAFRAEQGVSPSAKVSIHDAHPEPCTRARRAHSPALRRYS